MKAESFTNDLGQVLKPGNMVVAVSHCTRSINITIGEFVGISDSGSPQVRVPSNTYKYVHNETGEISWNALLDATKHLKWNTLEYKEARAKTDKLWTYTKFTGTRITTLHMKRVYKLAA